MTPRSLVGMTQGCRKRVVRARCWEAGYTLRRNRFSLTSDQLRALDVTERAECAKIRENYRIGQRLRPCPGCQECGVRRFTKPEGFFSDNTHYVEIRDNAKVRLWRLKHKPILWCSKCGPRSVPTKFYDLEYCVGMVERFEWIELTQPNLCDGSGVLPARARKVRR